MEKNENLAYGSNAQCIEKNQFIRSYGHIWVADILYQWSANLCDEMTFEQNLEDMRERVKWVSGRKFV